MTSWDTYRQQAINIELQKANLAKQQGLNLAAEIEQSRQGLESKAQQHMARINNENAQLRQQLAESQALIADWQASMEAWKDLAQALRDEIKACPNEDAHKFGQDDKARNERRNTKEDDGRIKRGLTPKYATVE
jgi:chromosome segregation ATPase